MNARTIPPAARAFGHVDPAPDDHFAQIDPATGRILSVTGPGMAQMPAALRASFGFQPIPAAHAHDFYADPVNRSWSGGAIGRCAPTALRQKMDARAKRAALLAGTDYLMASDSPVAAADKIAAWKAYRQALRDITKQPGFPTTITWPTPPA